MEKQMDINKNVGYIEMNDEFTIFYTNVDNVKKELQKIPANFYRSFGRGSSSSSYERFIKKRIESKELYLNNVYDYFKLFVSSNFTNIFFNFTSDYIDFLTSEKMCNIIENQKCDFHEIP